MAAPTTARAPMPTASRRRRHAAGAALSHLRFGRRRQVDADRPAALRAEPDLRGPSRGARSAIPRSTAPPAATSISRCCSTGWRPSASRASPSTSPTAISPRRGAPSSSPTRPATSNIPATWRPAPPMPSWRCCWSMRARASRQTRRHAIIAQPARHPPCRAGGEQDRSGRFRPGRVRRDRRANSRALRPRSAFKHIRCDPALGALRRQCFSSAARARPGMPGRLCSNTWKRSTSRTTRAAKPFRLPVQWVNRPQFRFPRLCRHHRERQRQDRRRDRGAAVGADRARQAIIGPGGELDAAAAGDAVTITLADEIDVARGDMFARRASARRSPTSSPRIWSGWRSEPLFPGAPI